MRDKELEAEVEQYIMERARVDKSIGLPACVVRITIPSNRELKHGYLVATGVAWCAKDDVFSEERGLLIAEGRARKEMRALVTEYISSKLSKRRVIIDGFREWMRLMKSPLVDAALARITGTSQL